MTLIINFVWLATFAALALGFPFPYNGIRSVRKKGTIRDLESSGSSPVDEHEPIHGTVKVVRLNPHNLGESGLFRRGGLSPREAPGPRRPFPAFLAMGRPGSPAIHSKAAAAPQHPLSHLRHSGHVHSGHVHSGHVHSGQVNSGQVNSGQVNSGTDVKKKQGFEMWQRAMDKNNNQKTTSTLLPHSLKDSANRQTCTAVPFTQRITSEGCDTVTVHNKLCFGQCSSLFIPSGWESSSQSGAAGFHRRAPCSRCAPSKAHTVTVPLRCKAEVREKHVMVVEECKCETGREDGNVEAVGSKRFETQS